MNIFIVDMIKGFYKIGALASPRIAALIPKQVRFLERVPASSVVFHAGDAHERDDSEFDRMPVHALRGTEEAEPCPEIEEVCARRGLEYYYIPKMTHCAFFHTGLEFHHAFRKRMNWVMFGCVTDICITANVASMDYRGRKVTIPRDLVDTYEIKPEDALTPAHAHDPETFNKLFFENYLPGVWGAKITTSEQLLAEVSRWD